MSDAPSLASNLSSLTPTLEVARRYWQAWRGPEQPEVRAFLAEQAEVSLAELAAVLRVDQRERWLRGERVPAEEYLAQFVALGASAEHALDLVYGEFLLREEVGEAPAEEEFSGRFPHFAEALRLQIELHRALARSSGVSLADQRTVPAVGEEGAARWPELEGYEVVGLLGRGGMGVVYRAWQGRLNRLVALKMVRGPEMSGEERQRFQAEYEILARLRHPNIVQIYEAGEKDGCPFFSMELVEGGSLDRLCAGRPQPPHEAARLVQTLAGAVHHAHGEGIVHRDLKPANVLLASGGCKPPAGDETGGLHPPLAGCVPRIADFGLAKLLRQEGGQTLSGRVVGTPCYLSPEQAAGRGKEVGPASDVYALGAILYELLTGRPPFQAATVLETLDQVRGREPLPPRQLNPAVPRDLETVCLECLHKEPHRRYATADALAEDLGRFLGGRPVSARPTPAWERGLKWAQRRPAVAGLLVALAAALSALLGLGAWSYGSIRAALGKAEEARTRAETERAAAVEAKDLAERKRIEAVRHARLARDAAGFALFAVQRFWSGINERPPLNRPGMEGLRLALLREAVEFYETFLDKKGDLPALRAERGQAYMACAQLTAKMGKFPQALELARKGRDVFARLAAEERHNLAHRRHLAASHTDLGDLLTRTNKLDAAEAEYEKALEVLEGLPHDTGEEGNRRNEMASVHHNLGLLHAGGGRPRDAEARFRRAESIRLGLVRSHDMPLLRRHPAVAEYKSSLAMTQTELANFYASSGRPANAERPCRAALAVYRELAGAAPGDRRRQVDLGRGLNSLGALLYQTKRLRPAAEALTEAVAVFGKLEQASPGILDYRHGLATALVNQSSVLDDMGQRDRAEAGYRRAAGLYARLTLDNPKVAEFAIGCAAAEGNLAQVLRDRGKTEEALEAVTSAVGRLEKLLREEKRYGPARAMLFPSYAERAQLHARLGRHAEALADWQKALAGPPHPRRGDWLVLHALTLARLGEHEQAIEAAGKMGRPRTPPELYNLTCIRATCSAAALADGRLPLGERMARAAVHASAALELLRQARAGGFFRTPANRELLRTDTDLEPLRPQEDFRRLTEAVEAQGE